MTLKEAEQINIGDKVIVKDYQGEHEVLAIQDLHPRKVIGYWLDNGDLINHKRVERVVKPLTDMDKLTTEMMEHICDNLCKHPCNAKDQGELDEICAECIMGKFVCSILNAHNRLKRPCKAGDKVYQTDSAGTVFESKITKIIYDTNGIAFDESAIGKTVFLTEQEALEKMKAGGVNG